MSRNKICNCEEILELFPTLWDEANLCQTYNVGRIESERGEYYV
jgi:hypothetical protein